MRKSFIAGNWKMFKTKKEAREFAEELKGITLSVDVDACICAPFTNLETLVEIFKGTRISVGAQNVHFMDEGAYTGEISIPMLEEIGVSYCIIGHSERRQYFAETDETVNLKLIKLFESKIKPIMCVGESLEQRDAGETFNLVTSQLEKGLVNIPSENIQSLTIAYEPIWAIGTGRTATPEQAEEMCKHVRETIKKLYDEETASKVRIQYGGSVKPANATDIMGKDNIDGALVGGASLKANDFSDIINF